MMGIVQDIKKLVLVLLLLVPGFSQAATITFPALDIQNSPGDGLTGALLTVGGTTTLEMEATAFDIIQYAGENISDDVDPDQIFSLTATSTDFDGDSGTFSGSFSVSGDLLSGTFDSLNVATTVTEILPGMFFYSGQFDGLLTYTGGSLQGSLVNGSIDGTWDGDATLAGAADITAKIDVAVIPVPAAVWLFGSGLLGLVGVARRKH